MNEDKKYELFAKKVREAVLKANPSIRSDAAGKDSINNYFNQNNGLSKKPKANPKLKSITWPEDIIIGSGALNSVQNTRNSDFPWELSWVDEINGSLQISENLINNLNGCPNTIANDFIFTTKRTINDLKNGPKIVGGNFKCQSFLTSLEGSPRIINGKFDVQNNTLTHLKGGPDKVIGHYNCSHNYLNTLEGISEIHGTLECHGNSDLLNFDHISKNTEFKGIILDSSKTDQIFGDVRSWLGFKPDLTDQTTEKSIRNIISGTNVITAYKEPNQRFVTYLRILKNYPNFLNDQSLMDLYKIINPLTYEEWTSEVEVPKYDNVPEAIIRRLINYLKK